MFKGVSSLNSTRQSRVRVLLADDHPAVAEGLRALLGAEFDVAGTVDDGYRLVAAAEALTPDVIVTDIAMPGLDGLAAAGEILRRNPCARIVFVTIHNDSEMVQKALSTGVLGYVLKLTAGEELVPATHAALRGERYISPLVHHGSALPPVEGDASHAEALTD
jgi:DNA-binding NarL/FixJ family response regulator